jgi:uncharacterized membrane protein YfcA
VNPPVVLAIAFGASLLGSVSGGSSSMITTPAWVTLGASFPVAVAADKVAGTFWTLAAARTYLHRQTADVILLRWMGIAGILGAVTGAFLATALDEILLRRGAGILILGALALSLRPRLAAGPTEGLSRRATAALGFPLGVYEGVLGSGNAILTTVLLQRGRGFELLAALGHYYALAALWCGLAALVYLSRGAFDARLALWATLGSVAGGLLGARLGRTRGTTLVRPLFLLAGTGLALRLLLGS